MLENHIKATLKKGLFFIQRVARKMASHQGGFSYYFKKIFSLFRNDMANLGENNLENLNKKYPVSTKRLTRAVRQETFLCMLA